MTREQIEKAAGEYSGSVLGFKDYPVVLANHKAFTAGAEWRVNSVWHDASDRPDENSQNKRLILIEHKADGDSPELFHSLIYSHTYAYFCVTRWAYIADLLPSGKEVNQ